MTAPRGRGAGPSPPCPCGSGAAYPACCGRWHDGPQRLAAPDAERLMRSRYAACVLGLEGYLLDTWHPSTRPGDLALAGDATRWLGLEVRAHRRIDDTHASVEFVARSRTGGRGHRLHELSRFVREAGRWWYVDGELR
jgi:SEC-C motif-containing protein